MEDTDLVHEFTEIMHRLQCNPTEIQTRLMTQGELFILSYLEKHNGHALPGELAEAMGVSTARISTALNNMEKKEFILRKADHHDRRRVDVTITPKGSKYIIDKCNELMEQRKKLLNELGNEDAKDFIRILGRIVDISEKLL